MNFKALLTKCKATVAIEVLIRKLVLNPGTHGSQTETKLCKIWSKAGAFGVNWS